LQATHYYTFSPKLQRLYASMRAVETGRARTFVGKSLAELKEIPQIFSFIKAKPNEKLQAQMQAMKDQAKKMKEEMKKVKDQAAKVEETMAKLQEQKKKIDEELAKFKKEKEEKDKKEQEKMLVATKDSLKNNPTTAKNNPKDNKNNKTNPKDNKNNTANTKNKTNKDSLANDPNAPKLTKQEVMVKEMDRLVKEIDLMGNIDELRIKKEQLLAQKNDFENPNTKANSAELKPIDHEKRKTEILAKLHEIDDLLKEIADDTSNDIISKRKVIKDKQRYLKNALNDMEKEKEKEKTKSQ
jgi:hypothetical protein